MHKYSSVIVSLFEHCDFFQITLFPTNAFTISNTDRIFQNTPLVDKIQLSCFNSIMFLSLMLLYRSLLHYKKLAYFSLLYISCMSFLTHTLRCQINTPTLFNLLIFPTPLDPIRTPCLLILWKFTFLKTPCSISFLY